VCTPTSHALTSAAEYAAGRSPEAPFRRLLDGAGSGHLGDVAAGASARQRQPVDASGGCFAELPILGSRRGVGPRRAPAARGLPAVLAGRVAPRHRAGSDAVTLERS
jgi:hypothetical protein